MLPEKIRAVIFDIDGTLVDSMGVWTDADRILLERRGIAYEQEISFALKSLHFMSAVKYLKEVYDLTESDESIASEITEIVREKYYSEIRLMPYVRELIENFKAKGIKMCAATSNTRELAEAVLKNNGILDSLDFIITSDEAGSSKEDPTIFRMCTERMDVSCYETAVIEDSPHAASTAYENGFFTVGVNSGHFGDFESLKECTDIRIDSFDELIG